MTLADRHRQHLVAHAVRPEIFEPVARTVESVEELPEAFGCWAAALVPGLLYRWIGASGATVWQLHADDQAARDTIGKYVTPERSVMPLGVHPAMAYAVNDPEIPLVIVEGTKQYLAATSALVGERVAVVGITGCEGWSHDHLPVPDFNFIPWNGRSVVIAFDADRATNRNVWEAARALTDVLRARGVAEVRYLNIPARGTNGLDDYLATFEVADRAEAMINLLDQAAATLGRAPARPRPDRGPYFDDNGSLKIEELADHLRAEHPMALTGDSVIAIYNPETGVYRKDPLLINAVVGRALGNEFRRAHLRDVEAFISGQLRDEGLVLPARTTEPIINVANGMLDLRTAELHPHDPSYLSHQQIPVEWDEFAECPTYEAWAAEIVGDVLDDLEEVASTMLDQSRPPAKAIILHGPSRSGKSTFLRFLEAIAGWENISAVSLHQLAEDRFASANLYGKILNVAADISSDHVRDLSLWKTLMGEDVTVANRKYGAQFTFMNSALMAFSCNMLPTVGEASRAYVERVKSFHFGHSYAGHEDRSIEARIMENELPGILARLVRANRRLRERGAYLPTAPEEQKRFETASNRVRRWVAEEMVIEPVTGPGCVVAADKALTKSELHKAFNFAAERDGEPRIGLHKFIAHASTLPGVEEVRRLPDRVRALNIHRPGPNDDDGGDPGSFKLPGGQFRATSKSGSDQGSGQFGQEFSTTTGHEASSPEGPKVNDTSKGRVGSKLPGLPECPEAIPLAFDLETADSDALWRHAGPGFVRLAGYGTASVAIDTDPEPVLAAARAGVTLVGHNAFGFDLLALARHHGLDLATVSAVDTKILAVLADPPAARMKDGEIEKRYSLDELGSKLFGCGKDGDLRRLAREFGGYDRIPTGDERFRAYLVRDVELAAALFGHYGLSDYARREHEIARIAAGMSLIGFRVDEKLLGERLVAGEATRSRCRARLAALGLPDVRKDGTPCTAPQATEKGREVIAAAFAELGVDLPLTAAGHPSLDQRTLEAVAEQYPAAADLAETVKELNGVRSVYQTIADNLVAGRVHPSVNLRQATGRWSVTKPGLTVMGKRDGKFVEREVFLAEPGEVLIAADLSQIDFRAIAGLCGDPAYLELFTDGRDAHAEIATMVWGDPKRREHAKAIGHGWNYGMGMTGLCQRAKVTEDVALEFDQTMRSQFPELVAWRNEVRERARGGELLDNGFGRKMRADPDRAHTQGPALMGQGCARDLLMTGILRLPPDVVLMLRAVIHDEIVLSVPVAAADEIGRIVIDALSFDWAAPGRSDAVRITAGLVGSGLNWGAIYDK